MGTGGRSASRKIIAFGVVLTLFASGQSATAAPGSGVGWGLPELQKEKSAPTKPVPVRGKPEDPASKSLVTKVDQPVWPAESQGDIDLASGQQAQSQARASATSGPITVSRKAAPAASAAVAEGKPAKVRVKSKGQDAARALGINGFVFALSDAGNAGAVPLRVDVDYRAFASAFGGDFASRLRLVSLPACALSTPDKKECRQAKPLEDVANKLKARTVSGDVTLPPSGVQKADNGESQGTTVLAATAGPSSDSGSFAATSLAAAGSWTAGASSGDFTYGYPLRVPPAIAGGTPTVSLGYSAQSLDGRISATNNQASIVGDGWDVSPGGFIERRYKPCSLDLGGNNGNNKTGDQCWVTDNATISLAGVSGELVQDKDTKVWRPKNDDGARVEKLTGAHNGDEGDATKDGVGEHWKVTTTDGTQYFLGMNRLPGWSEGKPETNSAWKQPVFGNNADEPCKKDAFDASWCNQVYRWNLDYSIDPHGNVTSYYYDTETNYYGRNGDPAKGTKYVRGGNVRRIEYGLRGNDIYGTPGAKIWFDTNERCLPSGAVTCDPAQLNKDTAWAWPDVPVDQICNENEQCTLRLTPTFFTRKKLTKITTQVGDGRGGFSDVDSWSLTQDFPGTGDGTSPAMNLKSIVHSGHVGGTITLPATTFNRTAKGNRVDTGRDNLSPLTRYRVTGVLNETGGYTEIRYSEHDCVPGTDRMPIKEALDENKLRCYPTWWTPEGKLDPIIDYFHKYVVTDVVEDDRTGASSLVKTHYDYVGDPAWHFDENDFAEEDRRTWSQWRGYGTVRTVKGDASEPQTVAETFYLRGMHGDRKVGGTRDVSVAGVKAAAVQDKPRWQGFVRETRQYDKGKLVSASVNDPWVSGVTATGADGEQAMLSGVEGVHGWTLLESGQWRETEVRRTFNEYGIAFHTEDRGDLAVTGDETCTRTSFAHNTAAWMLTYASSVSTVKGDCKVLASSGTILSLTKSYFDGQDHGVPPTKGDITKAEALDSWTGKLDQQFVTASTSTYDDYGRPLDVVDAMGSKTKTEYTPATGPVREIKTTNALGHVTTGLIEPAWGASTASIDANGRRADLEHDALGRLVRAWTPGHTKGISHADAEFEYTYNTDAPSVVTARQWTDAGKYLTSYTLYDGMMRERQTQAPSPAGGRILSDTFYDSRGAAYKRNAAYWNDQVPGPALAGVFDVDVPNQTYTESDGMGRPTVSIYRKFAKEQWRSTIRYGGDRVHTSPPAGTAATTVINDAQGRTVEKRQYTAGLGSEFDATKYSYTAAGLLEKVTDPAGNVWRYGYDLRGRKTSADDPDSGHSTTTYYPAGMVKTTTDGRGKTLAYTYDELGRKKAMFEGSETGTKLADWEYDKSVDFSGALNGLGMLSTSRRWVDGKAYVRKVTGYDEGGRPEGEKLIIPLAAEGTLGATYEMAYGYTHTGKINDITHKAVKRGSTTIVPQETIGTRYNDFGLPSRTSGPDTIYVSGTNYSAFGEVLRETYDHEDSPNNLWVTNAYEVGTRRLSQTIADRETATAYRISDRNYTYDASGNILKVADTPIDGAKDIQCFAYDYLRRLTEAWTPSSGDCAPEPSTPSLGGAAPYWMSWRFDKTGNRTTQVNHASAGDTINTFTYPAPGQPQPHTVRKVNTTGPNGTAQDTFDYDESGNTKLRKISGNDQKLEYDAEGRVSKVTNADGKVSTYLYDADGNRIIGREPSGTTVYAFGQEIHLATGTQTPTWTRYYEHAGHTVAVRTSGGGLKWLVNDHQGTNTAAVTQGNLQALTRRQTPFGSLRGSEPSSWPDKKGFVGGTNEESGLTRVGARLYDSTIGRFLSADPIIDNNDPQQMNGYAYSNNSPVTFADPTGLYANCGPDGIRCGFNPAPPGTPQYDHNEAMNPGSRLNRELQQQQTAKDQAFQDGLREAGISQEEYQQALANAHKTKWDVIKEVAWEVLKDISGWNDIVDCFTKGDILACGGLVLGLVPWGKLGKVIEAGFKAVRAVSAFVKVIDKSRALLRQVDRIKEKAARIADEFMQKIRSRRSSSCELHSFVGSTRVLMADGASKPIGDVKVGDKVKATDPATGETTDRAVVGTFVHADEGDMTRVTVDGESIDATSWHPVWVDSLGRFIDIGSLKAGDRLRSTYGSQAVVEDVQRYAAVQPVYDLIIQGIHTYHVVAGDKNILVHNCGEPSDALLDLADAHMGDTNVASEVVSADGQVRGYGVSTARSLDELTTDVRGAVLATGHHGGCGEIGGLCDVERQGGSIWGATAQSVDVMGGTEDYGPERHGAPRAMCPACRALFDYLKR